jgi:hypothetical protein
MALISAKETFIVMSPWAKQNRETKFTFDKNIFTGVFEFTCNYAYVHEQNLIFSFFDGNNYEDVFTYPLEQKFEKQIIERIFGSEKMDPKTKYQEIEADINGAPSKGKKFILFLKNNDGSFRVKISDGNLNIDEMRIEKNYLYLGTNKIYTGNEIDSAVKLSGVLKYHIDMVNMIHEKYEKSAATGSWERGLLYDAACKMGMGTAFNLSECSYVISENVKKQLCANKGNNSNWKEEYGKVMANAVAERTKIEKEAKDAQPAAQSEKNATETEETAAQMREKYATKTEEAAAQIMEACKNIKTEMNHFDKAKKFANDRKVLADQIENSANVMKVSPSLGTKESNIRRKKFVKRRH